MAAAAADHEPDSPHSAPGSPRGEEANVKVMVRIRPFNKREIELSVKEKKRLRSIVKCNGDGICRLLDPEDNWNEKEACAFDETFWSMPPDQGMSGCPFADQQYVYEHSGKIALGAMFEGYNCCIFAYGQTGSGKTYSMLGVPRVDPGNSPRMVDEMFERINKMEVGIKVVVEAYFMEIYNEKVRDLFAKKNNVGEYSPVKIRQDPMKGVIVQGLVSKLCEDAEKTKSQIERGVNQRAIAETKMNSTSSRSHAIFQLKMRVIDAKKGIQRDSTCNLVDLAGSEKIKMSGATGETLTEAKNINLSLTTLRKVIDALIENSGKKKKKAQIPFRESVLTWVLSDSLGGNSRTQMIAAISPHESNWEDTLNTMRYALKAKAIVCTAHRNEDRCEAMLDLMKDEIEQLQRKLREGGGSAEADEELRAQLEERERDMKQLAESQEELTAKLKEAQEKMELAQTMMEAAQEQERVLTEQVKTAKRHQFADAFKQAFLIKQEKNALAAIEAQLKQKLDALEVAEKEAAHNTAKLDHQKKELEALQKRSDTSREHFVAQLGEREAAVANLNRQLMETTVDLSKRDEHIRELEFLKEGAERRAKEEARQVERVEAELRTQRTATERERIEKEELRKLSEENRKELELEIENGRKRKEKYKRMFLEAKVSTDANAKVIQALQEDRHAFLMTIKAQQQLAEEHDAVVTRLEKERTEMADRARELEDKVRQRELDIAQLSEALREYQSASHEWQTENDRVKEELGRVTKAHLDLRTFVADKKFPTSASNLAAGSTAASPRRQPSGVPQSPRSPRHV